MTKIKTNQGKIANAIFANILLNADLSSGIMSVKGGRQNGKSVSFRKKI